MYIIDTSKKRDELKYITLLGYKYGSITQNYFLIFNLSTTRKIGKVNHKTIMHLYVTPPYHMSNKTSIEKNMENLEAKAFYVFNENKNISTKERTEQKENLQKMLAKQLEKVNNKMSFTERAKSIANILQEYDEEYSKKHFENASKQFEIASEKITVAIELYKDKSNIDGKKIVIVESEKVKKTDFVQKNDSAECLKY